MKSSLGARRSLGATCAERRKATEARIVRPVAFLLPRF